MKNKPFVIMLILFTLEAALVGGLMAKNNMLYEQLTDQRRVNEAITYLCGLNK